MQFRSFRIPFWFFITGILWAVFNGQVIDILGKSLVPGTRDMLRMLSDIISVIVVTIILYFMIRRQTGRLEESEEQYRKLFELNPNPMWVYNEANLRFVKVNQAAIDLYGYSMDEFLGMTIADIRPEEDRKKLVQYAYALTPGKIHAGTWRHLKKNRELLYASIVNYELDFNNEPCRLVMATNITDIILKEDKIKAQNAALHEIAWSNSHEIRRSLCSVMSLTALIKDAGNESERNEYVQLLQECTQDFDEILKKNNKKVDSLKDRSATLI